MSIDRITAARVFARDDFQCRDCGSGEALTIDHVTPLSQHGTDDLDNPGVRIPISESVTEGILSRRMTAARLGLDPDTVTDFVRRGVMPAPDGFVGRSPYWYVTTIAKWEAGRRGPGRPRKKNQ